MSARENLATAQTQLGELRTRRGEMWAAAERGEPVDVTELGALDMSIAVIEVSTGRLQRAATNEQAAEHETAWAAIEAERLPAYHARTAAVHTLVAEADNVLARLVYEADQLSRFLADHAQDQRRPATLGGVNFRDVALQINGVQMTDPGAGNLVLAVAGMALKRTAAGEWGQHATEFTRIRRDLQLPEGPAT